MKLIISILIISLNSSMLLVQIGGKATVSGKVTASGNLAANIPTGAFASPSGTSGGSGSMASPWDLQTAINKSQANIKAASGNISNNSIIYLRGGVYNDRYTADLTGSSGERITIKSYPGEWAILDGFIQTTISGALTNLSSQLTLSGGGAAKFRAGQSVLIDEEVILLNTLSSGTTFNILRGRSGGVAATSHSDGAAVYSAEDETLRINGSYCDWRDFEVKYSGTTRTSATNNNDVQRLRPEGISVAPSGTGTSINLINLVLHDNREGIGYWDNVTGTIFGCVIFNNGACQPDRSHGHGIYTQSATNAKTIDSNVSINNYTTGMKAFGVSGSASNYTFTNNISINNGSSANFPSNPSGYSSRHRWTNLLVASRTTASTNINVLSNYLYHPLDSIAEDGQLNLGIDVTGSTGLTVTGNRVMGGHDVVKVFGWETATIQNNKFYVDGQAGDSNVRFFTLEGFASPTYTWNTNDYYDGSPLRGTCVGGAKRIPFNKTGLTSSCTGSPGDATYTDWSGDGLDATGSTYTVGKPTSDETFYVVNDYATGSNCLMGFVVVYNWDASSSQSIDLSQLGFTSGQAYSLYPVENYLATAFASGTYSGSAITPNTSGWSVGMPIGSPSSFTPTTVASEFVVFAAWKGTRPF